MTTPRIVQLYPCADGPCDRCGVVCRSVWDHLIQAGEHGFWHLCLACDIEWKRGWTQAPWTAARASIDAYMIPCLPHPFQCERPWRP